MKKKYLNLLSLLIASSQLNAQLPTSFSNIDHNNVSALLSDGGIYFNNFGDAMPGYEIPKGNGTNAIYSTGFWYGGLDLNGQLKLSAQNYIPNQDIFPGPYSSTDSYLTPLYTQTYSPAIWKVSRVEIDQHIANYSQVGYVIPSSIANWPGNGEISVGVSSQLAPYVDLDEDGIYEPEAGDYPEIKGCEAVYIIVNDAAQNHVNSTGEKIGIEVHLMFYQYASNDYLNNTTFVSKKIINRGTNSMVDFTTTFYMDADVGNYSDDYVGCDSTRNLMYTYNGDDNDETNGQNTGFGSNPPILGVVSLNRNILGAGYFTGQGAIYPYTDPTNDLQYWNYMKGRWADGSPMVHGGLGYLGSAGASNTQSSFMFSGDPNDPANPNNWTEMSNGNPQGDRRNYMSINSGAFQPGDTIDIDYAILFTQGGTNFQNIAMLKEITDSVIDFYNSNSDICIDLTADIEEMESTTFEIYPNPNNGEFSLYLTSITDEVEIEINDLNGRNVFSQGYQNTQTIQINLKEKTGIYFVTLKNKTGIRTHKLVKE